MRFHRFLENLSLKFTDEKENDDYMEVNNRFLTDPSIKKFFIVYIPNMLFFSIFGIIDPISRASMIIDICFLGLLGIFLIVTIIFSRQERMQALKWIC